eukprot:m.335949 g.335949  ORF g.335949 m.335949 type:complete len:117 (+) comp17720_c0_seq1:97-447(+)
MSKRASFAEGGALPERETKDNKPPQTGRYDRKFIRARLDLEEWVDRELRKLYKLKPGDDDYDLPEIDLDEVLAEDEGDRPELIKNLIAEAKDTAEVPFFVKELMKKLNEMQKMKKK